MKEYWYPVEPARWKADTMHLTAEQDGIYFRLINHYMETRQPLPNNDIALARIAGVPVDNFVDNSEIIRAFFSVSAEDKLVHKKCEKVLKDQAQRSESYAKRGKKGGKARARKAAKKKDSPSNSQAIAKQQPSLIQAQDMTGQDRTEHLSLSDSQDYKSLSLSQTRESEFFTMRKFLTRFDVEEAKSLAPDIDIEFMINEFDKRVEQGKFIRPDNPSQAFVGWVRNYLAKKKFD